MSLDEAWAWLRAHPTELMWIGGAVALTLFAVVTIAVIRSLRSKDFNAKASIGFGVVQTGVAYITITGVYEFFHRLLKMPLIEAGLLAAFIEGCVWAAVGFIYAHGRSTVTDNDGKQHPAVGFGPAGPFFWTTVCGGGLLAILGSESGPVAIGRIVVVVLGAYMWYLRLLQVTRRTDKPSQWQWTPKRLLLTIGALKPTAADVADEEHEWQVRQIARAIRWSNGRWPFSWFGARSLVKRAESTQEDVIAAGRRRWAAAYVLSDEVKPDSKVMTGVIAAVKRAQQATVTDVRDVREMRERELDAEPEQRVRQIRADLTADLDALRAELVDAQRQLADAQSRPDLDAELDDLREQLRRQSEQLAQQQAATTAADEAAAEQHRRAQQLATELEATRAELEAARRRAARDPRIDELARDLDDGVQMTWQTVAERYGVQQRQAQRLLGDARKVLEQMQSEPRLSVVRGQ